MYMFCHVFVFVNVILCLKIEVLCVICLFLFIHVYSLIIDRYEITVHHFPNAILFMQSKLLKSGIFSVAGACRTAAFVHSQNETVRCFISS